MSCAGCGPNGCPCKGGSPTEKKREPLTELTKGLRAHLQELLADSRLMLFIKGTYDNPKCKWSRRLMHLIVDHNLAKFSFFDVLSDPDVRDGMKLLSGVNTYPMIYLDNKVLEGGYAELKAVLEGTEAEQKAVFGPSLLEGLAGEIDSSIKVTLFVNQPGLVVLTSVETSETLDTLRGEVKAAGLTATEYDCSSPGLLEGVRGFNDSIELPLELAVFPQLYIDREFVPRDAWQDAVALTGEEVAQKKLKKEQAKQAKLALEPQQLEQDTQQTAEETVVVA